MRETTSTVRNGRLCYPDSLKKINDAICSVVDHITLQDLVDWQRKKMGIM